MAEMMINVHTGLHRIILRQYGHMNPSSRFFNVVRLKSMKPETYRKKSNVEHNFPHLQSYIPLFRVTESAAYPSMHYARGWDHPRQVTSSPIHTDL